MVNIISFTNKFGMIKLKHLLKEINEPLEAKELHLKDVKSAIKDVFSKKYGYLNLYMKESDYIYISTDRNPERLSMYGDGNPRDYYLAISCYNDGEDLTVVATNASAGGFEGKGLTTDILKAVFQIGEKKLGPYTRKVLYVDDDASGGAWQSIARKVGAEYDTRRGQE